MIYLNSIAPKHHGLLLIEGESDRGISFEDLAKIAATTHKVEIESRRTPRPES